MMTIPVNTTKLKLVLTSLLFVVVLCTNNNTNNSNIAFYEVAGGKHLFQF